MGIINKQLTQQNLNQDDIEYTIYQTGLNLLAANGLCKIWMLKDYKQKQQRESYEKQGNKLFKNLYIRR